MLKSGAKIIPVFYDIRPSDLRWVGKGKGAYADAFAKHQKRRRFSSEEVAEWKAALQQLSNLHGLELNGTEFQGDWGKLLKSIVFTVLEAIGDKVPQEVGEDRVGLDEAIHDFQNFMQSEQQNKNEAVQIVGIVGIGGSGKTTLAKQFYNLHRSSFTKSSFLFDVRHTSAPQNLQSLQTKLLKDLLDIYQANIRSVAEGRAILRDRLRSSTPRVLIVLDDIDHGSQIEDLLVKEGALRRHSDAASVYKIRPLNPKHAQELFCRHAFGQPHPKIGFEDLVEDFCETCGRFPLSLKVMGAHLRVNGNDNRDEWREELEYKPDDVRYILKISSDALSPEEKQISLDIACFFLGERESMAIRVWNRSEGRAFRNLKNKCLVEVDDRNRLRMHDHLRDFARDIANIDSPFRFWQLARITNILKPAEKRMGIRGLMAATSEHGDCLSCNHMAFEKMELSRLKLLVIKGGCFQKRFGQASTNLMWLRWYGFLHTKIPSWLISIKNFRVLQLISGTLEEWRVSEKQLPLKELVIQNTRLSEISIPEDVCPGLELLDLSFNKC